MSYKVKELINILKEYNPQARVVLKGEYDRDSDEQEYDYLYSVNWVYKEDGSNDKTVVVLS
jgi:hypothetical protein